MLKSFMEFFDVVFPLNIGPLTYKSPLNHYISVKPGMLVSAEVKKTRKYGIVLRKTEVLPGGKIKEILEAPLEQPVFSPSMLNLLVWASEYYLVPMGLALKSMLPMEVFEVTGKRQNRKIKAEAFDSGEIELTATDPEVAATIIATATQNKYKTYLLQASSVLDEVSHVVAILKVKGISNAIVLVPEIADISKIARTVENIFGERLALLHGRQTKSQRRDSVRRIIDGRSDIVFGTRVAVFAPLKSVSLIAVLQEQNRSYKNLEGIRYNARDVAVMRGYIDMAAVVLSSAAPSIDSFYNTVKAKYTLLTPAIKLPRPRVEVVNMKTARNKTPHLSKTAVDMALSCLKRDEAALFLINRKGFSMLQCADCDHIEACPECKVPLVYHANDKVLKCHYCSSKVPVKDICSKCRGTKFEMVGAGTQRIAADLQKQLGVEPVRFDKDSLKDNPDIKEFGDILFGEKIIVGTKLVTERFKNIEGYRLCVFLNPDINLNLPDFRSAELLFHEIAAMSEHLKPGGLLLIQTRLPENDVFKYIKKFNYADFFCAELERRRALSYPPFSRLILLKLSSMTDLTKTVLDALPPTDEKIEVIGPLNMTAGKLFTWKLILKSAAKERLHLYAKIFLENIKGEKRLKVTADVDPVAL